MGSTGIREGGSGVGVSRLPGRHSLRRWCHQRMIVTTLLLLLSWGVGGGVRAMPRGLAPPPQFQDPASLPILDEAALAEIREHLANAESQERDQRLDMWVQLIKQYMAEAGANGDARMALPPPLLHSATASLRSHPGHQMAGAAFVPGATGDGDDDIAEEENKPKRVSSAYMSLCHFKICNMGRKRNYRYANPYVRV